MRAGHIAVSALRRSDEGCRRAGHEIDEGRRPAIAAVTYAARMPSPHATGGRRWVRGPVDSRLVDAGAVVLGVALTPLAIKTPWSPWPAAVIVAANLAGSAALWWRRRRPVPVTVIGAIAHVLSGSPWSLLVGLFTTASAIPRRHRAIAAATVVAAAGFVAAEWVDPLVNPGRRGGSDAPSALLGAAAQAVAIMAVGVYAGTRQELLASLRDRTERAEAERLWRDDQAKADERTRIAREMHDVLAHKMSLIAVHAGALEVNAGAGPDRVEESAAVIRSTAREALEELRAVLGVLRSPSGAPLDPPGQLADIRRLVESWVRADATVELRDDVGPLPAATARAAHRFVQEGLTNAHKHAAGAPVTVTLTGRPGHEVHVCVRNGPTRGPGPGPTVPGSGVGLVGLTERLSLVGGTLRSGPDGAGGWLLEGHVPWLAGTGDRMPSERPGPSPRPTSRAGPQGWEPSEPPSASAGTGPPEPPEPPGPPCGAGPEAGSPGADGPSSPARRPAP
jgi:signal transduction histidine kinase